MCVTPTTTDREPRLYVRCCAVLVAMFILALSGCEDAEVTKFNSATRELNRMLTTTGNDDSDVFTGCAAVEAAYDKITKSSVTKEQASAMKDVANSAALWKNQLTLMKLNALAVQLGQDKHHDIATDVEVARLVFPGIRRSVEGYVKKYD